MEERELLQPDPLDAVLDRLERGGTLTENGFAALSDLSRRDADEVRGRWLSLAPDSREELLTQAGELADERIEFDFTALARIGLTDPESDVRISAFEAAADSTAVGLGEDATRVLASDSDERVRAAAAAVLRQFVEAYEFGKLRDDVGSQIVSELRRHLDDQNEDNLVRAMSLESLGPHCAPWMPVEIEEAYASEERLMRLAAVRAMADSCDEQWLDYVFAQIESNDPEFRYEAAVAAGAIGSTDAVEEVARLLADDDPSVVLAAVEALGEIGGSSALEELQAFAPHAPEEIHRSVEDAIASAREMAAQEEDEEDQEDDE